MIKDECKHMIEKEGSAIRSLTLAPYFKGMADPIFSIISKKL